MRTSETVRPMLIGGELVHSQSGEWLPSINPANEEEIGRTPAGSAQDIARAVEAAESAQAGWEALGVKERARLLRAMGRLLLERSAELLELEVLDTGNTVGKMRLDVSSTVEAIDYYSGLGLEVKGETIPASPGNIHMTLREPYGVVGRIVPFNHPIKFSASRIAPALITGNTVVVKPPEQSPLSAGILAEICREVMPPGVVNIVTGLGSQAGEALVRHPRVKRIAFTGSVPTGMVIQRAAADVGIKHLTLELGGKNPMIVFPDADVDQVAEAAVAGMNFAWQGQSCGSTSRLLLHESLHDAVLERVEAQVSALRIGDPLDDASQMGPINSLRQFEKVNHYVGAGSEDGATLVTGGKRPPGEQFERGYWIEPTVFSGVTMEMRIAREEIFGPVLSVLRWRTTEEALAMANATEYGLTASIWTNDLKQAFAAAREVKSGYVWINGASRHHRGTPFGGYRNSGTGREEHIEELLSYTESKTIHVMLGG